MRSRWLPWFLTAVLAVVGFPAQAGQGKESECAKKAAARPTHDCISCEASVACLERITAAGGSAEIIPISHGLMVIYNTPVTRRVGEVQNAALERWDIMDRVIAGKGEGHLCESCCAARTLMVRADRQVYRTSTGVVAMITSEDFTVVRELHRMAPRRKVVPSEVP
ncbi:MAG: hypothetical protein ACREOU_10250 [Candidatus Eiseniibacteriota bacterium]